MENKRLVILWFLFIPFMVKGQTIVKKHIEYLLGFVSDTTYEYGCLINKLNKDSTKMKKLRVKSVRLYKIYAFPDTTSMLESISYYDTYGYLSQVLLYEQYRIAETRKFWYNSGRKIKQIDFLPKNRSVYFGYTAKGIVRISDGKDTICSCSLNGVGRVTRVLIMDKKGHNHFDIECGPASDKLNRLSKWWKTEKNRYDEMFIYDKDLKLGNANLINHYSVFNDTLGTKYKYNSQNQLINVLNYYGSTNSIDTLSSEDYYYKDNLLVKKVLRNRNQDVRIANLRYNSKGLIEEEIETLNGKFSSFDKLDVGYKCIYTYY